ncbi:hydroxymethylpyrimidine pyrophosphatase-like HAD family hydrolase [Saccharothrix ecbatanensis]|uniref:Hydroxymethylpyrimidine pyrophosphatase-like HAD family hydrolase n=1 Tax=Saccharothrix ecbatanensis TaxID=1105145 RepID=A0A7W9HIK8_9PSEU|nr:HAD family hydrolase [Saccharothrix ecbatanensis]MBB5802969.1 hydroxymethylpyrimidine pyrophosphatase-like HAD family hydrolase [Saccharothrix ecbatanensis]
MTSAQPTAPGVASGRLVCLDIDGTIADSNGTVSGAVATAIRELSDRGTHIVLATGRSLVATVPVFDQLDIDGYAVCSNGALTARVTGPSRRADVIEVVTFDSAALLGRLGALIPDASVAVEGSWLGFRVNREFPPGDLMGPSEVVGWARLATLDAIRVTIRAANGVAEELMTLLRELGVHSAGYDVLGRGWVDITPPGVSKATALENVRRLLGVEAEATYACGDQLNDMEMLSWAAHSVAMGGSPPGLQAVAGRVGGSVEDDGVLALLGPLLDDSRSPGDAACGAR